MPLDPFGQLRNQKPGVMAYLGADGAWVKLDPPAASSFLTHPGTTPAPAWVLVSADTFTQYLKESDFDDIDFLVGTATGHTGAEIVVGTTPGGELGGTWASPTVDATHSGSAHHAESHSIESHTDDAWAAYTPTVTQSGTVTSFTANTSKWKQIGRTVVAMGRITINDAGTAAGGNDVTVSLPVAALDGTLEYSTCGGVFDSSANLIYAAMIRKASSTTLKLQSVATSISAAASIYLGTTNFTAALATGDVVDFSIIYEAAS